VYTGAIPVVDPSFDNLWDDNPDNTDWGYLWERAN
jgi:hypothetical protein